MKKIFFKLFVFITLSSFHLTYAQIPILMNGEKFPFTIDDMNIEGSFKGILYFSGYINNYYNGSQLFRTDGTEEGTYKFNRTISKSDYWTGSNPHYLTVVNDLMFYMARDSNWLQQLWVTDGSESGTRIVKNSNSHDWYLLWSLTAVDNKLFFVVQTNKNGCELWKSDGTEAGTALVKVINNGYQDPWPEHLMKFKNELFFFADDGIHGRELWKTNGTESGTILVKDINIGSQGSYNNEPISYIVYSNFLFFSADDGINGLELWKTDGTEKGTSLVKDINKGKKGSFPSNYVIYNNKVYFSAADSSYLDYYTHTQIPYLIDFYNTELFTTDGSELGTHLVKDINQDKKVGSDVGSLMVCNNHLLFTAKMNEFADRKLYVSDGTSEGTVILMGNYPGVFANNSHYIYFSGDDGIHGVEPWKTDGTPNNTEMVYDLEKGTYGSYPDKLYILDTALYVITSGHQSAKLWKFHIDPTEVVDTSNLVDSLYNKFKVYPVPFKENLHISCGHFAKNIKIYFYNQLGQIVLMKEFYNVEAVLIPELNCLDPGLYSIKCITDGKTVTHKVVKLK